MNCWLIQIFFSVKFLSYGNLTISLSVATRLKQPTAKQRLGSSGRTLAAFLATFFAVEKSGSLSGDPDNTVTALEGKESTLLFARRRNLCFNYVGYFQFSWHPVPENDPDDPSEALTHDPVMVPVTVLSVPEIADPK